MIVKICKVFIVVFLHFISLYSQEFGCWDNSALVSNKFSISDVSRIKNNLMDSFSLVNINFTPLNDGYNKSYFNLKKIYPPKIMVEGDVQHMKKEGVWKFFHPEFNYIIMGEFINDKKNGYWTMLLINNEDTTQISDAFFIDDKPHGGYNVHDMYGNLINCWNFDNGFLQDTSYEFKFSYAGTLTQIIAYVYENGSLTETFYFWTKSGIPVSNQNQRRELVQSISSIPFYEIIVHENKPYNVKILNDSLANIYSSGTLKDGNGTLITYHNNGTPFLIAEYKDGLIHGEFENYNSNSILVERGKIYTKKSSHLIMPNFGFNADINLYFIWNQIWDLDCQAESFYVNGTMKGSYYTYYYDSLNTIVRKTSYFNEIGALYRQRFEVQDSFDSKWKKEGVEVSFWDNGQVRSEVKYKNGVEIGKSYFYNETGDLIRKKIIFDNGAIFNVFLGDTVNVIDSIGRKQGKWIYFSENSCITEPVATHFYENNNPTGLWIEGFQFKNNYRFYRYVYYDDCYVLWSDSVHSHKYYVYNGKVVSYGPAANLTKHGYWKTYYSENFNIKSEGEYFKGHENGQWIYYNKDGKAIEVREYNMGTKISLEKISRKKRKNYPLPSKAPDNPF